MAHFAQLDANNVVTQVIVVANSECLDANGVEREEVGIAFCQKLLGGIWKQTSYNGNFRKNYAGIGYFYDMARDAFVAPQPFPSWILNEETCRWAAPIPMPQDGLAYEWDEMGQAWATVI